MAINSNATNIYPNMSAIVSMLQIYKFSVFPTLYITMYLCLTPNNPHNGKD